MARFREQMAEFARAERFKDLRKQKGLSQADMGHEIGVSEKSWRAWEHGGGIQPYNIRKVVAYFKVRPDEIIERESLSVNGSEPGATPDLMNSPADRLAAVEEQLAALYDVVENDLVRSLERVEEVVAANAQALKRIEAAAPKKRGRPASGSS